MHAISCVWKSSFYLMLLHCYFILRHKASSHCLGKDTSDIRQVGSFTCNTYGDLSIHKLKKPSSVYSMFFKFQMGAEYAFLYRTSPAQDFYSPERRSLLTGLQQFRYFTTHQRDRSALDEISAYSPFVLIASTASSRRAPRSIFSLPSIDHSDRSGSLYQQLLDPLMLPVLPELCEESRTFILPHCSYAFRDEQVKITGLW